MDLPDLVTLGVLLEERHVTRAARRLGITQSSMSHRLASLRESLGDPLLVRHGAEMLPTPRALAMQAPLAHHLAGLRQAIASPAPFEPRSAQLELDLYLPDLLSGVLPLLVGLVRAEAPGVRIRAHMPPADLPAALARDRPSLCIAPEHFLDGDARSRSLGVVRFAVAGRPDHPAFDGCWDVERWLAWPHVVVRTGNGGGNVVERALAAQGLTRAVGLQVSTFLAGLLALGQSDLLMNVPLPFAEGPVATMGLRVAPVPVTLPDVRVSLAWNARFQQDPTHAWLRERLYRAVVERL